MTTDKTTACGKHGCHRHGGKQAHEPHAPRHHPSACEQDKCCSHEGEHGLTAHGGCCGRRHAAHPLPPSVRGKTLRIAVTSQNRKTVTGHAGKCRKFWIYEVEAGKIVAKNLLELAPEHSLHASSADHPLDDIDVLITAEIGDGLRLRLYEKHISVVVTTASDPDAVVNALLAAP